MTLRSRIDLVANRRAVASVAIALVLTSTAYRAGAQQRPGNPAPVGLPSPAGTPSALPIREAPTVQECLSAHRDSQVTREQLRLLETRQHLVTCSDSACPNLIRGDCVRWLDEISGQVPSVVFHISSGDGEQPKDVNIFIDGQLRFRVVPLTPVELDPGKHTFRFVMEGVPEADQEVALGEGNKARIIHVQFALPAKPRVAQASPEAPGTVPPQAGSTTPASATQGNRPVPVATYVFGGLGAVALVNFVGWGLSSKSMYSDLDKSCAPNCAQDRIDKVRLRAQVADISLGVSVVSFAAAAGFYFLRPAADSPVKVDVATLPHGGIFSTLQLRAF